MPRANRCCGGARPAVFCVILACLITISTQEYVVLNSTWMAGSSTVTTRAGSGTKGTPSPTSFPGARQSALGWFHSTNREIWIFSGHGDLNDLWRYRIDDGTWTWMTGSLALNQGGTYGSMGTEDPLNTPGARFGSHGWLDESANMIWVFGGHGYDWAGSAGHLNDLWRYNIATNQWAWMSGSKTVWPKSGVYGTMGQADVANFPAGRSHGVSFFDKANRELWLWGGTGYATSTNFGSLNDLWRYRISDGTWTWMAGADFIDQGTQVDSFQNASVSNHPTGREGLVSWFDETRREFWIMCGIKSSIPKLLNDLWRFRLDDGTWTWMSGTPWIQENGEYGIKGIPSESNHPGGRAKASTWLDSATGELWLFNGVGYDSTSNTTEVYMNDIWRFRPNNNMWTWMGGSTVGGERGYYGTIKVASISNAPGARRDEIGLIDTQTGELWFFGGYGVDTNGNTGLLNDLWRLNLVFVEVPPSEAPIAAPQLPAASSPTGQAPTALHLQPTTQIVFPPVAVPAELSLGPIMSGIIGGVIVIIAIPVFIIIFRRSRAAKKSDTMDSSKTTSTNTTHGSIKHSGEDYYNDIRDDVDETGEGSSVLAPMGNAGEAEGSQVDDNYTVLPTRAPNPAQNNPRSSSGYNNRQPSRLGDFREEWLIDPRELNIMERLGRGANGIVYRAQWRGAFVAVKQSTTLHVEPRDMDEFKREALLMLNLRPHPNCVQILGIALDHGMVQIVMELCANGSLDSLLGKQMSLKKKLRILKGVAAGVSHLHLSNIVHRDLAARNILLDGGKQPKVSDFGLARMIDLCEQGYTRSIVGPVRWMAPESLNLDRVYSTKSDSWSFANLVVEVLSEKEPYDGVNIHEVIRRVGQEGTPPDVPSICPEWLHKLLRRCWSMNPQQRPSMEEIFSEFESNLQK